MVTVSEEVEERFPHTF